MKPELLLVLRPKKKAAPISAAEKRIVAALVRMPPQRVPRTLESKIDAEDIDEARYDRNIPSEVGSGAAPGSTAKKKGFSDLSGGEADRRRFGEDATPKGIAIIRE